MLHYCVNHVDLGEKCSLHTNLAGAASWLPQREEFRLEKVLGWAAGGSSKLSAGADDER